MNNKGGFFQGIIAGIARHLFLVSLTVVAGFILGIAWLMFGVN